MKAASFLGLWLLGALAAPAWADSGPITAGSAHTCALTNAGAVQCWGNNSYGQLGDGTRLERLTPVPVTGLGSGVQAVAAGDSHTCALTTAGAVRCWGDNFYGQLGDGTTNTNRTTAGPVTGLGSGVQAIAAGDQFTCALTTDGAVLCWGNNSDGSLGDGTSTNRPTPVPVTGLSSGVQAITAGYRQTCALTTAGAVQCWGINFEGQLGDGTTTPRSTAVPVIGLSSGVQAIAAGYLHTCALTTAGAVQCWGRNVDGQLGDGTTTRRLTPVPVTGSSSGVQAIAAGQFHTCAITTAGAAQCWGRNAEGQLGDGTPTQRLTPVPVTGLSSGVLAIGPGNQHTCALTTAGAVLCWGRNSNGQLGDGPTTFSNTVTPVPVSGLGSSGVTPGVTLRGPATADQNDLAGTSVAIGDDGANETTVVGAPGTAAGGEVHVYVRAASSPTAEPTSAKALLAESFAKNVTPAVVLAPPSGGGIGDKFGQAVATSPTGSSIAVGAPQRDGNGRVFVYRKPAGGWESAPPAPPTILSPAASGAVTPQGFGDTLAYAADGTLVVGAPGSNVGSELAAGAAFAFTDNGVTVAPMGVALIATAPQANAKFGDAVAAQNGLIAIGAPDESQGAQTQQGAAYLFATASGSVGAATRLQPASSQIGDKFGAGVAIDSGVVVIGAPGDDTAAGTNSGSARVFRPAAGGAYSETSVLTPASGDDQSAGTAVAVREGNILIGAPTATAYGKPQAGRGYLYQIQDAQFSATENADAVLSGGADDKFGGAVAIGRKRLGVGVPSAKEFDGSGVEQLDIGRTDTFILDGLFGSGFE